MKKYTFTVILTGYGSDENEAWSDAVTAACLEDDPTPEDFEVEVDDFEYYEGCNE